MFFTSTLKEITALSSSRCHKNTHTLSRTCVQSTTRTTMSSDLPPMGIGPDLATRTLSAHTDMPLTRTNEDLAMRTLSACTGTPLALTNKDLVTRTLSACTQQARAHKQRSCDKNSLCAHRHAACNWLHAHTPRSLLARRERRGAFDGYWE